MGFTDFFIKRPVFATAINLLILLVGIIAFYQLTIRQFPKISADTITISTNYSGASASLMESFVTTPIEKALTGIDGLDYLTSQSSAGQSRVRLILKVNANLNSAMIEVQNDLSQVTKSLPSGVDSPTIMEKDSDSVPSMIVAFSSNDRSPEAITDYLTRAVIPQLTNIDGVSEAETQGPRTYAMRIWLNTKKMQAMGISANDVQTALDNENVQSTPGEIDREQQKITIDAQTDMHSAAKFNRMVIKKSGSHLIRLEDIGKAVLGAQTTSTSMYNDGKLGIGVGISFKSSANQLAVAKAVRTALSNLQLPSDIHKTTMRDSSTYIQQSITEVSETFFITIICVLLVIFAFLGTLRLVFIPLITIPLSMAGAFIIMYALNYSVNTLTLLAFVLAIGMVVDDAIVVMENIYRHINMGLSPKQAALQGTRQIAFAIIGMTVTLMAVYAPIGFTSGLTGALFSEFAFTLAGTVLVSGIIALTLSPMICSKMLTIKSQEAPLTVWIDCIINKISAIYSNLLAKALARKAIPLIIMASVIIAGLLFLYPLLQQSIMAPHEDQGVIMGMVQGPTSANINYTTKYSNEIANIYSQVPEKDHYLAVNGMFGTENSAMTILTLKDWSQRSRSDSEIIQSLQKKVNAVPGVSTFLTTPSSLPGSNNNYPFEMVLATTGDYQALGSAVTKLINTASQNPNITNVRSDLHLDAPQFVVKINRDKAAYLGVSMQDIDTALSISLGQPQNNEFSKDGYAYYVIPQLNEKQYSNSNILKQITVKTSSGSLIPLSTIMSISQTVTSDSYNHYQGQRSATIDVKLHNGFSTSQAITYFENLTKQVMNKDMSYHFSGQTALYLETSNSLAMLFLAAIIVIYLVLCAQFESFLDPLVILVSVPLAITGALACLFFSGGSLNIYTEIGLVTLIGLISKHGILMVEFAKQCRLEQGMDSKTAIHHAATIRLRPILMTTAAMVLGSVPLIFASGAGANARIQLGWVIVGGMVIGTGFTLFILPVIYTLIRRDSTSCRKDKKQGSILEI